MPIIEALVVSIGANIATAILGQWFENNGVAKATKSTMADIIKLVVPDALAQRRGIRQFDAIADKIAEDLSPLFEASGISEDRQKDIAWLAGQAIEAAQIDAKLLARENVDPVGLAQHIAEVQPQDLSGYGFSEFELRLYRRVVDRSATYIVDIASQFPQFTESSISEILNRESQLLELVQRIIQELPPYRDGNQFDADYRGSASRFLDRVELFGVNIGATPRRQRLTVAYVSLSANASSLPPKFPGELAADQESEDSLEPADGEEQDQFESGRIEELLARGRRLVIRGDAGSGKTTLLRWIGVRSANQDFGDHLNEWNSTIPFFVALRQFVNKEFPRPEHFAALLAPNIAAQMPEGWVHNHLKSGDAVVLIDGVDELPQWQRAALKTWLEGLTQDFGECRFMVTSRPSAIEDDWLEGEGFIDCEVQPMDLPDIIRFIERWHAAIAEVSSGDEERAELDKFETNLKDVVRASRPLRNLATNPLLCAVICALHRARNQQLPSDRIQLYEACCEMLLDRRESEQGIHRDTGDYPELSYRQKRALLEDLSYWMMQNSYSSVAIEEADGRFEGKLSNMPGIAQGVTGIDVRRFLVDRSGVIREPVAGEIDFTHRTFEEFFAAQAAVHNGDVGLLVGKAGDDQWRETVILAAGLAGLKAREELVGGILERGDKEPRQRQQLHLLAVACLETSVELGLGLREAVQSRLRSLVPPKNMTDAKALSSAGDLAVPFLSYDEHLNANRTSASVRALALIGGDDALHALTGYAHDHRVAVTRELIKAENSFDVNVYRQEVLSNLSPRFLSLRRQLTAPRIGLLEAFKDVVDLDLSHNELVSLPPELLERPNLRSLNLSNNLLSTLPRDISQLTNLESLDLSENPLITLPAGIPLMTNLRSLNLSQTGLNSFPQEMLQLTNLQTLRLRYNQIGTLPPEISHLTKLRTLDLVANHFNSLPREFTQLTNLAYLNLSRNEIDSFPPKILRLINLRSLTMTGNQMSTLPAELGDLSQLRNLGLQSNRLSALPPEIGQLTNLMHLDVEYNQLSALPPELGNLTGLVWLDISHNPLTTLPEELSQLNKLSYLILSEHQLTTMSPIIKAWLERIPQVHVAL